VASEHEGWKSTSAAKLRWLAARAPPTTPRCTTRVRILNLRLNVEPRGPRAAGRESRPTPEAVAEDSASCSLSAPARWYVRALHRNSQFSPT